MKALIIILILLILFVGAHAIGHTLGRDSVEPVETIRIIEQFPAGFWQEEYPDPITVEDAMEILRQARFVHQYYLGEITADPNNTISGFGDISWQMKWIKHYDQLRELIIKLNGGE